MPQRRSIAYLTLIIIAVVLPTAVALVWYHISRDPNLRPLGITEQALRAYEGRGEGLEIVAIVDWVPPRTGNFTRAHLTTTLRRAFGAKGADVRIVFRDGQGETRVSYVVGKTALGPYATAEASKGVAAAIQAFNMH